MSTSELADRPRLTLSVQYATEDVDLPPRPRLRRWVMRALQSNARLTIRFVDAEEGRMLNRDFRGKDYPTNVLTFAYGEDATGDGVLEGDIALCVDVLKREAAEQNKPLEAHCAHLVVHGTLHLQGYDHENDEQALEMETLETDIMKSLGYPDPYTTLEQRQLHHG